jgi:Protein of unknown function (DUF2934)
LHLIATQAESRVKKGLRILCSLSWPTDEQRRELIAVTAYYLAERRNFQPGHEDEDWLAAEAEIGRLDAAVS